MGICYIVGAGEFHGSLTPRKGDLVIAADGGYNALSARGIRCDVLLGDMDSIIGVSDPECEVISFPVRKDETDAHLGYLEGVRRGYTDFYIYGGTGGRSDHTFANYSLLLYAKNRGHRMVLVGDRCEIFLIKNEDITLSGAPGAHLSVFAFCGTCEGVSITGAEYEAHDVTLTPEFPLGVSNAFGEREARISVKSGALLIMREV